MSAQFHPYHLVNMSPWPLFTAISAMTLTTGLVKWFTLSAMDLMILGLLLMLMLMLQWWRDVVREGTLQGFHSLSVKVGLQLGMILFITSEVLFFFSFFWAFFHSSLSPVFELGGLWPPSGIITFKWYGIPLLNTVILLSSGVTVTWAHHSILESKYNESILSLGLTVLLGIYFTMLQAMEYIEAPFCISDSVYGSTFFVATGFHGLHVIIGTIFLLVCLIRLFFFHMSSDHHFGFEAAAWYWHFVDVVWLFLYVMVYWWGGD
uniref:cytochrome c oxidase subunit III n=1 Tax=Lophogaster typicus TaxID=419538 RepID=UPI002176E549|nr:cytochrome c oxidase subunit III [Lophogaster typicus]UUL70716.1 cytochrome c oxidase subunit III [Lophogaster typicus]